MKNLYFTLWFLFFLTTPSMVKGQELTIHPLGTDLGLNNNYVTDIAQDRKGRLWIATEGELSCFYGNEFISFNSYNSGLSNNALNALLYEQNHNRMWIGTKNGLYTMDCDTREIEPFELPDSAQLDNVVSLTFAPDSSIWITNLYHSIIKYHPQSQEILLYNSQNTPGLYFSNNCAIDDGKGHLYIGHSHGGLSILDLKTRKLKNFKHDPHNPKSLPADWVNCIYIDHFENIWIGTKKGLSLYNPQKEEFTNFYHQQSNKHSLLSDDIYDIQEINKNELWIACEIGGISILNLRDVAFNNPASIHFKNLTTTSDEFGLSSKNIRKIFQDFYGNIWIGNYSKGLDFISRTQPVFHTLPYVTEGGRILTNKPVGGIYTHGEEIWIGSENELALFRNNRIVKTYNLSSKPFSASNSHINTLLQNGDELLLGMSDNGIIRFHLKTGQSQRLRLEQDNESTHHLYQDASGKIWIGAESGLYSYTQGILQKEQDISLTMNNISIFGIVHDNQGKLWVGTHGAGVFIFNENEQLERQITRQDGLCDNSVFHLYKDSKGDIWAATREGVTCMDNTQSTLKIKSYGYVHGLKDVFTRAISEDKLGYIWVSTTKGLSCLNPQSGRFANYDYRDGIPEGNFSYGSVSSTNDGSIYFGSLNGVCYFQPEEIVREQALTPVSIIECKVINDRIENHDSHIQLPTDGEISLPYKQNSLQFIFTIPDYSQSPSAEYAYMMKGLTKTWTHTQGEKQVTFRNLPTGDYTFLVKARLPNQEWDETQIASIKIQIHPPLWLTWYAKVFYTCLLIALFIGWSKIYKRRLQLKNSLELIQKKSRDEQELNQERLRFYTNITHELRTPLTLILGPLEDLTNDPNLPTEYGNKVKVIHSSAIRLLNLINQILEFRKTETQNKKLTVSKGNLKVLVTEVGYRFKELNRNDKVNIQIHTEEYKEDLYFDTDVITTILNNLLSNAMKYTAVGEIILAIQQSVDRGNHYTEIIVKDTGTGIKPEALPHIFNRYYQAARNNSASGSGIGLALVKSLAELHEGSIQVESLWGQGSTFTFRILTQNSYPSALHKEELEEEQEETITTTEKNSSHNSTIILVIEDNDDIREYIASSLSQEYQVLTATNGQEGLELAQQQIPDIILSDVMMPIMDGFELCRQIKKDVRTSHIPVVLLTAKDSIHDKEEGYQSGADSYITKPFSVKLLISRIHNLQQGRERLAEIITHTSTDDKSVDEKVQQTNNAEVHSGLSINKLDEAFLNKLTQIVDENISDKDLNIAFLTEKMNMTPSTLYRKIKGLTGLSGNEFIRKYRLQKSLKFMYEDGLNISETAYACGFSDSGYFRNCFKQEFGMTPSEYLKQFQRPE